MKKRAPLVPPKYPEQFLQWILKEELVEEVLGDLEEKFYQKTDTTTPFKAKANYWYQTFLQTADTEKQPHCSSDHWYKK